MRPDNMSSDIDLPARYNMTLKSSYGALSDSNELSLTDAIALSRIPQIMAAGLPKVKKANHATKLKFRSDKCNEIFEFEPLHASLKDHIWYSQEEYVEMTKSLDDATRRRKQHTAGIRKCYIHSILDLQEEHRAEGIYDPKGLACMAKRCTKYSTRDAATRGKEMEKEATRMKRSETLDILKSVLSMMDEMDASCQRKQDTSLQPPMRLMSPKREY